MSLVYIISVYDEYGAECVHATLNPERLPQLLDECYNDVVAEAGAKWKAQNWQEELQQIAEAVASGKTGKFELSTGWGGYQLHIVEIE